MDKWPKFNELPKRLPDTLTDVEQVKLLSAPKVKAPTGHRDLCMIRLMLDTGIRASECLNLEVKDIDWMTGKFKVRKSKRDRARMLWMNQDDLALLTAWRERRDIKSGLLFTTLHGTPIQSRDLRAMVKRRAKKVGILKDVHPHMLRHTFATDLYRKTLDILLVQKALGHADITTTVIYTHLADHAVETAMQGLRSHTQDNNGGF